jgi:predicted dehydrogenase
MKQRLRVGVIGANPTRSWAKDAHIPALQASDELELAAVATTNRASADAAGEAFGVNATYADAAALISAPDIDIISICVKVPYHRNLVLDALANGKHVYCEWPLGRTAAEADEMAAAARTGGTHVAIGVQARMSPAARRARELLASGAIGRPLTAYIFSSTAGYGPEMPAAYAYLNAVENGANLITILGGHTLDLATLVLGPLDAVNALATTQYDAVTLSDTAETITRTTRDHLLVLARATNGSAVSVEVAGDRPPDTPFTFEVIGTQGRLLLSGGKPYGFQAGRLTLEVNGERHTGSGDGDAGLPAPAANVAAMYAALAHDIRTGNHTAPDFDHALRLTHLTDDILTSAETGARVTNQGWPLD